MSRTLANDRMECCYDRLMSLVLLLVCCVQVGHCSHVSAGTEDETCSARMKTRPWSPRTELVACVRPPNRTIGHLYDTVLVHQRTCRIRDVSDARVKDDEVSASTTSTFCCCRSSVGSASRPKRIRFTSWTRKKKR